MKNKIILVFTIVLVTQLSACKKKENMNEGNINEEKLDWEGLACTPEGYPVVVLSPNQFSSNHGKYITLIPNMSDTGGSTWNGSGNGMSSEPAPAPNHLSIVWYAPTEMKIYEGEFDLPQQKIYQLFKEGYMIYGIPPADISGTEIIQESKETLHWETYNSLLVGLAPKGMVVVWLEGQNKVELGRFQARELGRKEASEVYRDHFQLSEDMPDHVVEKELISREVPPKVREEIKRGKLSYKQWDDYRLRYNWKVEFNIPLEIYHYDIKYFNGEQMYNLPANMTQEVFNKNMLEPTSKGVASELQMYITAKNGRKYLIRIDKFDEQETLEGFKTLEEASPKATITIFITVSDDFKNFSVMLKNDKKEIVLEKAPLRLFTLNKSNDLSMEK